MEAYLRSAWHRLARALTLISLGWGAAGFFFVFIVNDGRVWPDAYRFIFVYVGLQLLGLLSLSIGRTRYQAWSVSRRHLQKTVVAGADSKDAEGAA